MNPAWTPSYPFDLTEMRILFDLHAHIVQSKIIFSVWVPIIMWMIIQLCSCALPGWLHSAQLAGIWGIPIIYADNYTEQKLISDWVFHKCRDFPSLFPSYIQLCFSLLMTFCVQCRKEQRNVNVLFCCFTSFPPLSTPSYILGVLLPQTNYERVSNHADNNKGPCLLEV